MNDKDTITITGSDYSKFGETIVIDLNQTYGATTSYATGIAAQEVSTVDPNLVYTIDLNDTISLSNVSITTGSIEPQWWVATEGTHIEIEEVEKMCKEYPALAKVYENFKTVYDLVKQDWEGKKDADKNS